MRKGQFNHYELVQNFERLTKPPESFTTGYLNDLPSVWVRIRSPEYNADGWHQNSSSCPPPTAFTTALPTSTMQLSPAKLHSFMCSCARWSSHVKLQGWSTRKVVMGKLTFVKLKNLKRVVAAESWKPSRCLDSMDIHDGHKQVIQES